MAKKILLADDSVTIQKVVELTFMDQDYEVTAVGNGDAAIEALEAGLPHLVIADVHMPGADGYAVCRKAKASSASLPVLLLVGTFEPFEESEVAACGADGFLRKPFDSAVLFAEAERLLAAAGATASTAAAEPEAEEFAALPDFDTVEDAADSFEVEDAEAVAVEADALEAFEVVEQDSSNSVAEEIAVEEPAAFEVEAEDAPAVLATPEPAPAPPEMADPADDPEDDLTPADAAANGSAEEELVERIARRVVELMSEKVVREVAWDVIPDMAEVVIRDRIRELEADLET